MQSVASEFAFLMVCDASCRFSTFTFSCSTLLPRSTAFSAIICAFIATLCEVSATSLTAVLICEIESTFLPVISSTPMIELFSTSAASFTDLMDSLRESFNAKKDCRILTVSLICDFALQSAVTSPVLSSFRDAAIWISGTEMTRSTSKAMVTKITTNTAQIMITVVRILDTPAITSVSSAVSTAI